MAAVVAPSAAGYTARRADGPRAAVAGSGGAGQCGGICAHASWPLAGLGRGGVFATRRRSAAGSIFEGGGGSASLRRTGEEVGPRARGRRAGRRGTDAVRA